MKKFLVLLCAGLVLFGLVSFAVATPIQGQGQPTDDVNLVGATVIDFESTGVVTASSLTISDVTFTGDADISVDSDHAGYYNTRGTYHITNYGNQPTHFRFDFSTAVNAFAFLFGASDSDWTLSAFDDSGTLLEMQTISPVHASNYGDYFGIANSGIAFATLDYYGFDYIFIDNFTYSGTAPVPEPSTILLMGAGLLGLVGYSRKRSKK